MVKELKIKRDRDKDMEYKSLADSEFILMVEEEKRLCEKDVLFIKALLRKDISTRDKELVKEDKYEPAIKLKNKLKDKDLYKSTKTLSRWKYLYDLDIGKLFAFLLINFPEIGKDIQFCFEMDLKLRKAGEEKKYEYKGMEIIAIPMEFEKETDIILQWMELFLKSDGNISIIDGEEPAVGVEGVPDDIPYLILEFFDDFIKKGGFKRPVILVRDKEGLKKY